MALLICSGGISATETALFALDRGERLRLKEGKSPRGKLVWESLNHPRRLLSTLLFGSTLINVATSAVATLFFSNLLSEHNLFSAIVADSVAVVIFGEIIPKTIAVTYATPVALRTIGLLHVFAKILRPVVSVFDAVAGRCLLWLRVPEISVGALSQSELEVLFDEAGRTRTISHHERRIARNILRFSETKAKVVMTPRARVAMAKLDVSREDLEELMVKARHSRVPLYEDNEDNIVGFIRTKEFFLNPNQEVSRLLRPVCFFPESARINSVFSHMQKYQRNMAVIVDDDGKTSGIVTIEDLLEEIVGEIYDEYEKEDELILPIRADEWFILCRVSVDQVNKACGLSLPKTRPMTLNEYLCGQFGEVPAAGKSVEIEGILFTIIESRTGRIVSCRAERLHREAASDA